MARTDLPVSSDEQSDSESDMESNVSNLTVEDSKDEDLESTYPFFFAALKSLKSFQSSPAPNVVGGRNSVTTMRGLDTDKAREFRSTYPHLYAEMNSKELFGGNAFAMKTVVEGMADDMAREMEDAWKAFHKTEMELYDQKRKLYREVARAYGIPFERNLCYTTKQWLLRRVIIFLWHRGAENVEIRRRVNSLQSHH